MSFDIKGFAVEANLFIHVTARRYERGSTIVTSNLVCSDHIGDGLFRRASVCRDPETGS